MIVELEVLVQNHLVRQLLVAQPARAQPANAPDPQERRRPRPLSPASGVILLQLGAPCNLLHLAPEARNLGAKLDVDTAVGGLVLGKLHLRLLEGHERVPDAPGQLRLVGDLPPLEIPEVLEHHRRDGGGGGLWDLAERTLLDKELGDALHQLHQHRSALEERDRQLVHLLEDVVLLVRDHVPRVEDPRVDQGSVRLLLRTVNEINEVVDPLDEALHHLDPRRLPQNHHKGLEAVKETRFKTIRHHQEDTYTPHILHAVDCDSCFVVEEGRSIVLGESVLELGVPHPLQSSRCHCFVGDELR
jgi:hypothetical protein